MSGQDRGRDIGPDEDRPSDHTYPHSVWPHSQVGGPISAPSDDTAQQGSRGGHLHSSLHSHDLEEDNSVDVFNPLLRPNFAIQHPVQTVAAQSNLPNNDLEEDGYDHRHRYGLQSRRNFHLNEPTDASDVSEEEVYNFVFSRQQRGHFPQPGEYYKHEENRLRTFGDWPPRAPVKREDLARNGFIYTGSSDKVRCVFCNGVLRQWQQGDVVEQEHQRLSPDCPFVRGEDVGNIPFHGALNGLCSESVEMSDRSHGATERGYDIGPDEDRCGITLPTQSLPQVNGWAGRSVGDARAEFQSEEGHARKNFTAQPRNKAMAAEPDRLATFETWPAQMRQRPEQLAEAGLYYIGDSDKVKCFHCGVLLYDWEPNDDPWKEHARWCPQCQYVKLVKGEEFIQNVVAGEVHQDSVMETPAVLAVLSVGYTVEIVRRAITILRQKEGSNAVVSASKLMEVVMELEGQPTVTGYSNSMAGSADMEQLQRENESLRDKQLCKICMERDVEVIFYPCKHVACCAMCGSALTTCPICREPIHSLDKVYMA